MRMRHAGVVAGLALALMSRTAQAETFRFSYDAGAALVSGTLIAIATGNAGQFQVTDISGNRGIDTITGLADYNGADNLIFIGQQSYVDAKGLSYAYSAPSNGFANLSFNTLYLDTAFDNVPVSNTVTTPALNVTFTQVSNVPLPASAPMFGAALLALGAVGYGVKRKKAAATA